MVCSNRSAADRVPFNHLTFVGKTFGDYEDIARFFRPSFQLRAGLPFRSA